LTLTNGVTAKANRFITDQKIRIDRKLFFGD
jgi:hypothetical protein